jgi:hypothetical protein
MRWYQVLTSDTRVTGDNDDDESNDNHEEDDEWLEETKNRRLSLSADRCENPGAE